MDANAKIGKSQIKGDPHESTANGKLLCELAKRQNLVIANSLDLCRGVITRERITKDRIERSVIDYILMSRQLVQSLTEMLIDDERVHTLHRYVANKNKSKRKILSDHNLLFSKFGLLFNRKARKIRKEVFQYKNEERKKTFKEKTSTESILSSSFTTTGIFSVNANIFFRNLKKTIQSCFKKIRIKTGRTKILGQTELQAKLKSKAEMKIFLKNNKCNIAKNIVENNLDTLETYLEENCAQQTAMIIKEQINEMKSEKGKLTHRGMWKIKRKLFPDSTDPPIAKIDFHGNLITSTEALENLYVETYKHHLRQREIEPKYEDIFLMKTELWERRLIKLKTNKTSEWNTEELEKATANLKTNKTSDPNNMINELFKEGCIGSDLKEALLLLVNGIKSEMNLPEFVEYADIVSIYKNKGSKLDMKNDRGIFILTAFKKMIDKLTYNDLYEDIDENMSASNIGARKGRNIYSLRKTFIVYAIINSIINGNEPPIDLQIYDLIQCFDSLWLDDCMNDVYDTVSESNHTDKLALVYESNQENLVSIKTANFKRKPTNIPNIVQQGGTWGSLLCSNSIDTLGRKCEERGEHFYMYKGIVKIIPLAMVDDLMGISSCGLQSVSLNTFLTTNIEMKKLRFHTPDENGKSKCHKIHVGGNEKFCPKLKVHGIEMANVKEDTYLGDVISGDGQNTKNINKRIAKGLGIISSITNLLDKISLGVFYVEIFIVLRNSMFINGILTNTEVWHNFKKCEVEELEELDRSLIRKVLKVPITTPKEALHLELGILPIGAIIKSRRLMYLHYLLNLDNSEMLHKVFITQWNKPVKGDWSEIVKEDLEDFEIRDTEVMKNEKKYVIKKVIKEKARAYALTKLTALKSKHSKMENLQYSKLKIQKYLKSENLKLNQILNLFKCRTRMAEFGENYRAGFDIVLCPLCLEDRDNLSHSFECSVIKQEIDIKGDPTKIYDETIPKEVAQTITKILKFRTKFIEKMQ